MSFCMQCRRNLHGLPEATKEGRRECDMSWSLFQKVCAGCGERTRWMVRLGTRKLCGEGRAQPGEEPRHHPPALGNHLGLRIRQEGKTTEKSWILSCMCECLTYFCLKKWRNFLAKTKIIIEL